MPNCVSLGRPLGGRPGGSPRTSMGWDMTHRGRHRSYQGRPRTPRGRPNCPADVHGTVDALWTQQRPLFRRRQDFHHEHGRFRHQQIYVMSYHQKYGIQPQSQPVDLNEMFEFVNHWGHKKTKIKKNIVCRYNHCSIQDLQPQYTKKVDFISGTKLLSTNTPLHYYLDYSKWNIMTS